MYTRSETKTLFMHRSPNPQHTENPPCSLQLVVPRGKRYIVQPAIHENHRWQDEAIDVLEAAYHHRKDLRSLPRSLSSESKTHGPGGASSGYYLPLDASHIPLPLSSPFLPCQLPKFSLLHSTPKLSFVRLTFAPVCPSSVHVTVQTPLLEYLAPNFGRETALGCVASDFTPSPPGHPHSA